MEKIRLGISSCLLGEKVRYDGGHKLDYFLRDTLGRHVDWVAVCPEAEYGLPVPREAMHLVRTGRGPRLMTSCTKVDHTDGMLRWAGQRLKELEKEDLCGFVFKSGSPSSGMRDVKVYDDSGAPVRTGAGLFAGAFVKRFPLMPAEDEGRLQDPSLRENFIGRIFVFRRWKETSRSGRSLKNLLAFHTDHKLLILSHSPGLYTSLGRLLAGSKRLNMEDLYAHYLETLMQGLRLPATVRKNTNVLQHISGYFKRRLTAEEKQELHGLIRDYHLGMVPLIVPIVLINHYAKKYDEQYLLRQTYLKPDPAELMLKNHA